jgi:glutathione S-transferase
LHRLAPGRLGSVATLKLYDYPASGNCLKVRILLAHLELDYERIHTDIFGGDTLSESYAAKNPARQTPLLEIDGTYLPESSAILWYLAEGTQYLPADPLSRANVLRWLLFEQGWVSAISGLRFRLQTGRLEPDDPSVAPRRESGRRALAALERHLDVHTFLVDDYSIADIANYAYVHVAPEIEIPLDEFPSVARWINAVEDQPGFVNDLLPLPESSRLQRGLSLYG